MGTNKRTHSDVQDPDDQDDVSTKRTRLDTSDLNQASSRRRKEYRDEFPRDAYTVGWICALPVEQTAAVAMLDSQHECPPVHEGDTNNYVLGRIGKHNVAIACTGSYGSVNAAVLASHMQQTFPFIRIRLMVGIGGGAPGCIDVRLGDVVVSHPTETSTGVEQYDSGKTEKGGVFKQTGKLSKPPPELRNAVTRLRAHHESRASQIPAILAKLKEQDLRMAYPGAGQDRLFGADYEHQGRNCTDCDPSRLVKQESRLDNNPIIHYGAIASANQVMKHGKTRDRISKELNVLCFEMEAAGLMDNFPCLVIRGICDYADSHKTKEWQPYASATAAAYAKELLLIMHTHEVQKAVVASSPNARSAAETEQNRSLLLNSLKFESINDRHDNIKKAHAETCQWLMQHPDYADWQDPQKFSEHHGLLWISGKPGAGKSTIMKFAVSQASRREQGTVISYFFNARGEDLEKTVPGLYRSLLYQLLRKLPDLQEILDDQSHSLLGKDLNNSWSIHRLKSLFLKAIERLGSYQVTCFIDALDECAEEEVREMLAFFEELGECAASNKVLLYACFSSRHYPHIHIDHCLKLTLEAQAGHAKDLEDYVRTKLKNEDGESPQTIEIVEEIIQKASGVFMWAVLVIDILNMVFQKGRMFAVRKRLDTIPEKLSDLFRDMLVRDNENMDEFRLCIQWILYSRRPLKRQEFYFAMVSGLYPESLEHQGSAQISRDAMDRFVIDSSKGLAQTTVTSEKTGMEPTVQFIHESVRDFLLKDNGIEVIWPQATPEFEATSHEKLKSCCASYIKMADLGFLPPFNSVPVPYKTPALTLRYKVVKQYPFMEYANSQLFHHADCAAGSTPQVDFMEDFLSTGRAKWIVVHNLFEWREVRQLHGTLSLLCILAIHNSACLIRQYFHHDLQERGPRSWPTMEHHCTPLHAAIFEDAEEAAEALLLCSGKHLHKVLPGVANEEVDVDYSSSKGYTALLLAAEKGQDRVVKELLRLGADVTHKTNERNPLGLAIEKGHVSTATLLIPSDSCPSGALLRFAVQKGSEAMVQTLLDGDEDFDSSDEHGYTALHVAAEVDVEAIAQILLGKGADVQKQDKSGRSPLCVASEKGHLSTAKVLIQGGADVDHADSEGHGALWRAVLAGNQHMAKLLLDNGAEVHRVYSGGYTLLHIAAERGDHDVARLLLANGARVNQTDQDGKTPLHCAIRTHPTVLRELIKNGADVNSRDNAGETPIFSACRIGSKRNMQLLLENGADLSHMANNGETAFLAATAAHQILIVREIISYGIKMKIPNLARETGLGKFLNTRKKLYHKKDLVDAMTLLDGGASAAETDNEGLTILHRICEAPIREESFRDLTHKVLSSDADINARDNKGRTPLLLAAKYDNSELVETLLDHGADPNLKDKRGSTPLYEAINATQHFQCRALQTASALIGRGADPEIRTPGGLSIRNWVLGMPETPGLRSLKLLMEM